MSQILHLPQHLVTGKRDESNYWRESHEEKRNQESTKEEGCKKEEEISVFSQEKLI